MWSPVFPGSYYVGVTNSLLTNLTLTGNTIAFVASGMFLSEVTPIRNPYNISYSVTGTGTPDYTFSATMTGTITYSGSCSSIATDAVVGDNTITLDALADGTYSDCSLTVTNGSDSGTLAITPFSIDTVIPTFTIPSFIAGKIPTLNIANSGSYTLSGAYTDTGVEMQSIVYSAWEVSSWTYLNPVANILTSATGTDISWTHTWTDFFNNQPILTGTGDHGVVRVWIEFYDAAQNR